MDMWPSGFRFKFGRRETVPPGRSYISKGLFDEEFGSMSRPMSDRPITITEASSVCDTGDGGGVICGPRNLFCR